jgi:carbon storage regulator CsrA
MLSMLVLSRKSRESVVVGGAEGFARTLTVTVLDIKGGTVRLGFEADADIPVNRLEVWERKHAAGLTNQPQRGPLALKEEIGEWADDGGAEG